ncbi:putative manganese-dependent inorganic diphosphatase [Caldanaerobacter subterraneus]|uniref:inorganic diphosphatase n=2 Tax=Caldanaerobacter subterraneus TaxID=911092 RepID=Q8R7G5_CALS4|nr:putative manganese-dependent inorganic diphosphatase [Caldanaerobacter subterraneus]AAM25579.1 Inorganic pyrophosphatase/exopolyphosphatase [Caldanaerobacter subterraneus subsp. tengcongensis MB4]MBE3578806.1 putative manganese-dependent inorganic diphosphatase [Caldanaerobacter subterraneus]MCS3917551.1 manganese-dependent inorganic pyrophosphatase [Caldanaerobacter subterraneus subsp. tengcongensis MB4]TCO54705.1 manganese-dependent inorganic pyrophosphatase [Caldanaerobacter subterraneus]
MKTVYVCGHKNPDTDSICSAIAYAHLKRITEGINAIPVRLGPINRETKFVLDYFGIEEPIFIENVYTQVQDIKFDKPLIFKENTSMFEAWNAMMEKNIRTLAVVDDENKLIGIATVGDLAKAYLSSAHELSKYRIPIENLLATLKGEILLRYLDYIEGNILVAAMSKENVLKRIKEGDTLIVGDREDIQEAAIQKGVKALIITGNNQVSEKILDLAEKHEVTIIKVSPDTFDTVKLLNQSIPLSYVIKKEDIVSFRLTDYIDDVKEVMLKYRYRNFPVLDEEGRVVGLLGRRHILDYERKNVILVDHNEFSQAVEGIEQARILEIIDHHRLGTIETDQPILFRNHPVGSTATIINRLYEEKGLIPDPKIAGIMCAAILSDTLVFKSPTCTPEDVRAAKKLAEIAEIDINEFGNQMFKAGTSLEGKTVEEIFYTDFKEFTVNKYKIGIGQVNTLADPGELKKDLISFMEKVRSDKGYDILLLMLTDIINEGSEILFVGDNKELLERAFDVKIQNNSFYLPYVISRKKQVLPPLVKAINTH